MGTSSSGTRSLKAALATGVVAGAALLSAAAPASAANPPYSGCPSWALCLYQHGGGTGSKAIITPTAGMVTLYSVHFLNGDLANNQASSWLNNSTCQVRFVDDPYNHSDLDFTPSHQYGATGDWAGQFANDRLTGVHFSCP
ncbi:peptidase inhibitor family I36 protein [Streptomyces genisteinicus]|uniref:Peptidase inhibitor family I36 protein n=1 Tax=Streptomyces genisteinicus TaxID=2768068 RepID=A0A7H0HZA9_9ACTN|nr:peptidase inhibitor family I36 protein [Streptomyces genisteinicus]QNP65875.1 peptidase inhibitor family I36 protein [Streptomyces genisteinicus]